MKGLHILALSATAPALLIFAASSADAQMPVGGGSPIVPISSGGGGPRIVPLSSGGQFQGGGPRSMPPGDGGHRGGRRRFHGFGGFGGVWIVEREVVHVVEREVPAPPPFASANGPPPRSGEETKPRKPYVIGNSYASLPGGCMKLIEDGASYYYCSDGEWYKQTGKLYRAVARKL